MNLKGSLPAFFICLFVFYVYGKFSVSDLFGNHIVLRLRFTKCFLPILLLKLKNMWCSAADFQRDLLNVLSVFKINNFEAKFFA